MMASYIKQSCLFLWIVLVIHTQPMVCKQHYSSKPRPVIFMHGLLNKPIEPDFASMYIPKMKPGTVVYTIDLFNRYDSLISIGYQLKSILPEMKRIMSVHNDTGINLLCYSQGGVICRAALQMLPHNVYSFISLSCPITGQYGVTRIVAPYLPSKDRKYLWEFFYTSEGQDISIGNYWNDPHHKQEFTDPKLSVLLAVLNNQTGHRNSSEYRENFMRLSNLVLVGGPDDSVITPWQSAQFGYYDNQEQIIGMENQTWYKTDDFGLRTLNEKGRVHTFTFPGIDHLYWYRTKEVYDKCVIPYL